MSVWIETVFGKGLTFYFFSDPIVLVVKADVRSSDGVGLTSDA